MVRSLVTLLSWLPPRLAIAAGRLMGDIIYHIDRRHRRNTLKNLQLTLNLSGREGRAFAHQVYRHLGQVLSESVLLWVHMTPQNMKRYIVFEGLEHVQRARAAGRGAIFVTGHIGNWELCGLLTAHLYGGVVTIAQPMRNPRVDRWLIGFRSRSGQKIVPRKGGIREMLEALRRGEALGIVMDQDARRRGIIVPFFGLPASTVSTAPRLALSTGAPIITVYCHRIGMLRYRMRCCEPIFVKDTGDRAETLRAHTAELNAILERAIRCDPVQWLWPHSRWKTGLRK